MTNTNKSATLPQLLRALTAATCGTPRSEHGPFVRRFMDAHPEIAIVTPGLDAALNYAEAMQIAGEPGVLAVDL